MFSKKIFVRKVAGRPGAKGQKNNILTKYLSCLTWDQAELNFCDALEALDNHIILFQKNGRGEIQTSDLLYSMFLYNTHTYIMNVLNYIFQTIN